MKPRIVLNRSLRYLKSHSPDILTFVGAVGLIATTISAINATQKATRRLDKAVEEKGEELTTMEKVQIAGPYYIPTVVGGTSTLICMFGANALNQKQQATLMSAYMLMDRSFKEYKEKVKELYGEEANENVENQIVKGRFKEEPIEDIDDGKRLFYEEHYGNFFESTVVEMQDAMYQLNRKFVTEGEIEVNDFFELLGLDRVEAMEGYGWTQELSFDCYNYTWIDIQMRLVEMEDGMECYILHFPFEPVLFSQFG